SRGCSRSGLGFSADLPPADAGDFHDPLCGERRVEQDRAGCTICTFWTEVFRWRHARTRCFTNDDAHHHAVTLVRTTPNVINARMLEGVAPALPDRDHRRRERRNALGYALRLALQRVVGGNGVMW